MVEEVVERFVIGEGTVETYSSIIVSIAFVASIGAGQTE